MLPRTYEEFLASRKKAPNTSIITAPERKAKLTARKENNFIEDSLIVEVKQPPPTVDTEDTDESPTGPL